MVVTLTTIRYGVLLSLTSAAGTQAVDWLGRCASRTLTQPGLVATTGSTDGLPYQRDGTVPPDTRPGIAYLIAGLSRVATSAVTWMDGPVVAAGTARAVLEADDAAPDRPPGAALPGEPPQVSASPTPAPRMATLTAAA